MPDTDPRADEIEGLRRLADFLDTHPLIPVPELNAVTLHFTDSVAEYLDGVDVVPVAKEHPTADTLYVSLVRPFAGIDLTAFLRADLVGAVSEQEETVVSRQFSPFTVDEITRAARAACDPMPAPTEIVTAP